ncbi:hypothetical protein PS15m_008093 [Mucor circinelloides]
MESSLDDCEELLLRNCFRVRKIEDISLAFCYDMFLIFLQQMFAIGGLGDLETVYNYRLIWRLFDVVVKPLQDCIFIPGEVQSPNSCQRQQRKPNGHNQDDVRIKGRSCKVMFRD